MLQKPSTLGLVAALCATWLVGSEARGEQVGNGMFGGGYEDRVYLRNRVPRNLPNEGLLVGTPAQIAADQRIREAMRRSGSLRISNLPLPDFAAILSKRTGLNVLVDEKALEEAAIDRTTPITLDVTDVSYDAMVRHVLRPLDLTWIVDNEVALITTKTTADFRRVIRVYPVQDLILVDHGDFYIRDYTNLLELILSTIDPTTWSDGTGPGPIKFNNDSLVVSQVRETHDEIAALLAQLREAKKLQARTQTRRVLPRSAHSRGHGSRSQTGMRQ